MCQGADAQGAVTLGHAFNGGDAPVFRLRRQGKAA